MIKVENLVKSFGPKFAVDDVSFSVERGEVLGDRSTDPGVVHGGGSLQRMVSG